MRVWLVVLLMLLGAKRPADACSCSRPEKPCAWVFSGTSFVGRAIGTTKVSPDSAVTTFEVIETLFSPFPLGKRVDVSHGTDGAACGVGFDRNVTYVVDAGTDGPLSSKLATGLCSSTHAVTGAVEDDPAVKLVRAGTKRTKARVEGMVSLRDAAYQATPKSGVTFRVQGTTMKVTSAAGGKLDFDIAPGSYQLELATPGMATWRGETFPVVVPHPAACATVDADVYWNGEVHGRVTDAAGVAVNNAHVGVVSTSTRRAHNVSAYTRPDGTYSIDLVPPGDYQIGVAVPELGGSTKESPYATVYYPKLVSLKEGTVVRKVDIVVGPAIPMRTVKLAVVHRNGRPAAKATVRIDWLSGTRHTEDVDANGVYALSEFDGAQLALHACIELADSNDELCTDSKYMVKGDATVTLTLPAKPKRR